MDGGHIVIIENRQPIGSIYTLPAEAFHSVMRELANSPAQLRLMVLLLASPQGTAVVEKDMCEKTGMSHESFIKAKRALEERGFIKFRKYTLQIVYENLMP